MNLSDVTTIDLGSRKHHYRQAYGAFRDERVQDRAELCDLADQEARDEMLQEVHTMLCYLCKIEAPL